jgi:hypothetical protein
MHLRSVQSAIKGTSVRENRTMLKLDSVPAFVTTAEACSISEAVVEELKRKEKVDGHKIERVTFPP